MYTPCMKQFLLKLINFIPWPGLRNLLQSLFKGYMQIEKIVANPKATALITTFLQTLTIPDDAQRIQALLPLVHKSLTYKNPDGSVTLDRTIKEFSYQKALKAFQLYSVPANVKEVHRGNTCTVGFGENAELGRTDKYFISRKDDTFAEHPVPMHIFWPQNSEEPKILKFDSL